MMRSLPDPSLAAFDPEIERTISRMRRARRWLASEGGEVVSTNSPVLSEGESEAPFEEETSSSSTDSVDLCTDFKLKTLLINLLPKFHGLPAQEPIKHL
ncbi:hypothetical protein AHAS_Ahas13G0363500 [Arachis hypogaea]